VSRSEPARILLLAEGQLGDLLLLTPTIRGLRERFPAAAITLLVVERRGPAGVPAEPIGPGDDTILSANPHLTEVLRVRRDHLRSLRGARRLAAELKIVRSLRHRKFDVVVSSFPEDRFAAWSLLTGAATRVGEAKGLLKNIFTDIPPNPKGSIPVSAYYASLGNLLGADVNEFRTELNVDAASRNSADDLLMTLGLPSRAFVLLHPGATGDYKIWPPEMWAELTEGLARRVRIPTLLCGGPADKDILGHIGRSLHTGVPFHVEQRVMVFSALAEQAALVISNDSGPRHIAVAAGTPSLALFRLHHDREWAIYPPSSTLRILRPSAPCPLCPRDRCEDRLPAGASFGAACLRHVSVDEVLKHAIDMLFPDRPSQHSPRQADAPPLS